MGKSNSINSKSSKLTKVGDFDNKYLVIFSAGIILFLIWFIYRSAIINGFLNWDDDFYITQNPDITILGMKEIIHFFSSFFMGNYHPLTMTSFMFEYSLFKSNPSGYHTVSVILHLINTLLVFLFIFKFCSNKLFPAVVISLFFGLHPMHVESVVWISERKDLLYTFFLLISLLIYLEYLKRLRIEFLLFCFFTFLLSLLSKGQAVIFPIILLLVDYFRNRPMAWKMLLEKVPFFLFSLIFGVVAIFAQKANGAINEVHMPFGNSPLPRANGR